MFNQITRDQEFTVPIEIKSLEEEKFKGGDNRKSNRKKKKEKMIGKYGKGNENRWKWRSYRILVVSELIKNHQTLVTPALFWRNKLEDDGPYKGNYLTHTVLSSGTGAELCRNMLVS